MPTVPRYDSPQVAPARLPEARVSPLRSYDTGEQARQLGQDMARAGEGLQRISLDMAQRVNDDRMAEFSLELQKRYDNAKLSALQLQGKNALERPDNKSLMQETAESFDKDAQDLVGGLSNDYQRAAAGQLISRVTGQLNDDVSAHVFKQAQVYRQETQQGGIAYNQQRAGLLYGDEKEVAASRDNILTITQQQLADEGITDPETRAVRLIQNVSPMHSAVLTGLLDGKHTELARQYYDKNSAEMTLQDRANVQKALLAGEATVREQSLTDAIIAKHPNDMGAALSDVGNTLTGTDRDNVRARVKQHFADQAAAKALDESNASDSAWTLAFNGKTVPPTLMARLSPESYKAVSKYLASGPVVDMTLAGSQSYGEFENMGVAEQAKMTVPQFYERYAGLWDRPHLEAGAAMLAKAKSAVAALTSKGDDATHLSINTLPDVKAGYLASMGGYSDIKKSDSDYAEKSEKNQAILAELQSRVRKYEDSTGKKATPDDVARISQEAIRNKVKLPGWFSDKSVPYSATNMEQINDSGFLEVPRVDGSVRKVNVSAIKNSDIDRYNSSIDEYNAKHKDRPLEKTWQVYARLWSDEHPKESPAGTSPAESTSGIDAVGL